MSVEHIELYVSVSWRISFFPMLILLPSHRRCRRTIFFSLLFIRFFFCSFSHYRCMRCCDFHKVGSWLGPRDFWGSGKLQDDCLFTNFGSVDPNWWLIQMNSLPSKCIRSKMHPTLDIVSASSSLVPCRLEKLLHWREKVNIHIEQENDRACLTSRRRVPT